MRYQISDNSVVMSVATTTFFVRQTRLNLTL